MVGLITEYNPFHNGHLLHINRSKEITNSKYCIVVMSGNFVQRGEPALFDKYLRTKMALLNGADIVIELPVTFSTSSAEFFALGGVDLLDKTGIVKKICFGTEKGDFKELSNVSEILAEEPENFKKILKEELKRGISFPKARENAISKLINLDLEILKLPNNILALEYLKALKTLKSDIIPFTIKREYAHFNSKEISGNIASATAIRNAIFKNDMKSVEKCVPKNIFELINSAQFKIPDFNDYTSILKYLLTTKNIDKLSEILDITEGLENRILQNTDKCLITDIIDAVKSKRYTYSKIKRAILHLILDIKKEDYYFLKHNLNPYIRILGFKRDSSNLLSKLIENAKIPVITNIKKADKILDQTGMYFLKKEVCTTDLYYLNYNKKANMEYREPLVII